MENLSEAGPRGLREEFADSDSTQDLCPGEVTGQRQIRGKQVFKKNTYITV